MREPETFDQAVKLADRFDSLFSPGFGFDRQRSGNRIGTNPTPILSRPANPVSEPTPMEIDVLRRRVAPITDAERDRLRKIGGCFRCLQPGHIATNCPLNQSSVQRPQVNHVEQSVPATEQPDLIDLDSEPRCSENFTPLLTIPGRPLVAPTPELSLVFPETVRLTRPDQVQVDRNPAG
jgi:hypothetical protein